MSGSTNARHGMPTARSPLSFIGPIFPTHHHRRITLIEGAMTAPLDAFGTMMLDTMSGMDRDAQMRIREALIGLLRAVEDGCGLPRSVPTWKERNGVDRGGRGEYTPPHHGRKP